MQSFHYQLRQDIYCYQRNHCLYSNVFLLVRDVGLTTFCIFVLFSITICGNITGNVMQPSITLSSFYLDQLGNPNCLFCDLTSVQLPHSTTSSYVVTICQPPIFFCMNITNRWFLYAAIPYLWNQHYVSLVVHN